MEQITGSGGGKGGGGGGRVAREDPNTLQSHSVAKILDLLGEGEIGGLVDGARSIYLDGTPLQNENGEYNFQGVTWDTRDGLPEQDYVRGHNTVETQQNVGVVLESGQETIRTINNVEADGFRVTVQLNRLTKQDAENGDLHGSLVEYEISYREKGGSWKNIRRERIEGKTTSIYRESVRLDLDGEGPWDVRVRRITEDNSGDSTIQDQISWAFLATLIDGRFQYPDSAYVALELDAKQFGNTVPSRSYDVHGLIVQVPSNYDPESRTYDGLWGGSFKRAWTDNPAWLFYAIALNKRYGAGLPNVDKFALYKISRYCDEMVENGYGGMEPRFTLNTVLNSRAEAMKILNSLASSFRGLLYWGSDTVMPVQDAPEDPRRQFGASNWIADSVKYTESRLSTRHTVAFVTWNDPDRNYEQTIEVVEDKDGILAHGWNKVDITAFGCTSRGQARRFGLWTLATERLQKFTIELGVGPADADIRPGDIIDTNDESYQGTRVSGRLSGGGGFTTTEVAVDKFPEEELGDDLTLTLRLPNGGIEHRPVASVDGTMVTVSQPFSQVPVAHAVWMLSSTAIAPKKWRVMSVVEESPNEFTITALQHEPGIYDYVEKGLSLPDTPYTTLPTGPLVSPLNITLETYTYRAGGSEHQGITVSWSKADDPRVQRYIAQYMAPGETSYYDAGIIDGLSFDIKDAAAGEWQVRVASVDSLNRRSNWVVRLTTVAGLLEPVLPDSVDIEVGTFSVTLIPNLARDVQQLFNFYVSTVPLTKDTITANARLAGTSTTITIDKLKSATQYFFYIQGLNNYGVTNDFYPVQATTLQDFDDILGAVDDELRREGGLVDQFENGINDNRDTINKAREELGDSITNTNERVTEAQNRIDAVDLDNDVNAVLTRLVDAVSATKAGVGSATQTVEQLSRVNADEALSQRIVELNSEFGGSVATIRDQLTTLAGENDAIADRLSTLRAEYNSSSSSYDQRITAIASETESITNQLETLTSSLGENGVVAKIENLQRTQALENEYAALQNALMQVQSAVASASISVERQSSVNERRALSQEITEISSEFRGATASNRSEIVSLTSSQNSLAQRITSLDTEFGKSTSNIRSELTSLSSEQRAIAQRQDTYRAEVNGEFAEVKQNVSAVYDPETGAVAQAVTTVEAGGRRALVGIQADGDVAEVVAIADRFAVINPVSGESITAFVVQDGRVIIRDAFIRDGSIDNAKIRNGAIDNAKIENGAINNAKIQNGSINGAKIEDAAITNAKIQNASVDSLKIQNESIIVPRQFFERGNVGIGSGNQRLASLTLPSFGQTIQTQVTASFKISLSSEQSWAKYRVRMYESGGYLLGEINNGYIRAQEGDNSLAGTYTVEMPFTLSAILNTSGNTTIYLDMTREDSNRGSLTAGYRCLFLNAVKRTGG